MKQKNDSSGFMALVKPWLFLFGVLGLYGLGIVFAPERTYQALNISGSMFLQLALPVCLALIMMVILNRFLSPAVVTLFLGQNAGIKGVFLSSLAGILSMGPVYAWYPLLKSLRDKGATEFHLANFIGNRSIKPVLLPVLIIYLGWYFTSLFVLVSFVGALIVAWIVRLFYSNDR